MKAKLSANNLADAVDVITSASTSKLAGQEASLTSKRKYDDVVQSERPRTRRRLEDDGPSASAAADMDLVPAMPFMHLVGELEEILADTSLEISPEDRFVLEAVAIKLRGLFAQIVMLPAD
jgi:hypothetical protein